MKMFEANYPETMQTTYIVNGNVHGFWLLIFVYQIYFSAPKMFPFLFNIAKPFLSEETRSKVKVLGGIS
jgi:hypothetical protein